jgi:hypothetical protein
MVSAQLSLFDTAAVIKPTYKVGDLVKVKKKTPHAPLLKKGNIVQIEAIHPHNGSCKFWNELTESWGYLYPDEFVLIPPSNIDSPTPAEVVVGESITPLCETAGILPDNASIESNCPPSNIDSPTPAEAVVGESIAPLGGLDYLDPISIYKPRGTARGDKDNRYYRLSYKEGGKVRQVHIRGGNTDSPIAQAKVQEVRSLLAAGIPPREIAAMLKSPPKL